MLAARNATSIIPIVIAVSGDPVGLGLVKTLARPGENLIGVTYLREQVATKGLGAVADHFPLEKAPRVWRSHQLRDGRGGDVSSGRHLC